VLGPDAIAIVVSIGLAALAGFLVARINRRTRREMVRITTTLVSRGEFSLILVSLAVAAGLDERLSPFIGVYVLVPAVLSPVLAEHADRLVPEPATSGRRGGGSERGSG
jgi:CPA2 family monovalent cation:H+ antiporter-2